jgi:hypothetical protein
VSCSRGCGGAGGGVCLFLLFLFSNILLLPAVFSFVPGGLVLPTGVPPHIGLAQQVAEILDTLGELVRQFGEHGDNLMFAVEEALEGKAWESGHVTGARLKQILDEYKKESIESVDRQLSGMRAELRQVVDSNRRRAAGGGMAGSTDEWPDDGLGGFLDDGFGVVEDGDSGATGGQELVRRVRTKYQYDGRFFAVPKGYQFPRAKLKDGLRSWLMDQVVSVDGTEKVRALRFVPAGMLPAKLSRQFRTNWQPIFKFLDPVLKDVPRGVVVTEGVFERVYSECTEFLKDKVSYLWKKERSNPMEYSVGTWSNKTHYSSVKKLGTDGDKDRLIDAGSRNKEKREGAKRKRKAVATVRHPVRQDKRVQAKERQGRVPLPAADGTRPSGNDSCLAAGTPGGGTSFRDAFADVGELTVAQKARMVAIERDVAIGDEAARNEEEERTIREEGWASRPIPTFRNYGDMSGFDRQQLGERMSVVLPPASPMMTQQQNSNGREVGHCCVTGCTISMELVHRCHICRRFIHMICAEPFSNLSEDERYCSACYTRKKKS